MDQVAVGSRRPPRRWVGRIGPTIVLIACGLFFVLPLLTMARYSFQNVPTILLTWSNVFFTHAGSSGSRSATRIFSAGVAWGRS